MTAYGPYTPVRRAGDYLFVSGQIGVSSGAKTASPGIAEQTTQALANLKAILTDAGATMDDVVKTTVFLVDMQDFAAMNEVYEHAFKAPRPARSTVAVSELPRVANTTALLVEVEAVAYKEAL